MLKEETLSLFHEVYIVTATKKSCLYESVVKKGLDWYFSFAKTV